MASEANTPHVVLNTREGRTLIVERPYIATPPSSFLTRKYATTLALWGVGKMSEVRVLEIIGCRSTQVAK